MASTSAWWRIPRKRGIHPMHPCHSTLVPTTTTTPNIHDDDPSSRRRGRSTSRRTRLDQCQKITRFRRRATSSHGRTDPLSRQTRFRRLVLSRPWWWTGSTRGWGRGISETMPRISSVSHETTHPYIPCCQREGWSEWWWKWSREGSATTTTTRGFPNPGIVDRTIPSATIFLWRSSEWWRWERQQQRIRNDHRRSHPSHLLTTTTTTTKTNAVPRPWREIFRDEWRWNVFVSIRSVRDVHRGEEEEEMLPSRMPRRSPERRRSRLWLLRRRTSSWRVVVPRLASSCVRDDDYSRDSSEDRLVAWSSGPPAPPCRVPRFIRCSGRGDRRDTKILDLNLGHLSHLLQREK